MSSKWKGKQPVRQESSQDTSQGARAQQGEMPIDVTDGLRAMMLEGGFSAHTQDASMTSSLSDTTKEAPTPPESGHQKPSPMQRPLLIRKTATAPPGSLFLNVAKPHPPRRAISARGTGAPQGPSTRIRRSYLLSPLLPRLSQIGTAYSRSLISRRKSSAKASQRPKRGALRAIPPKALEKYESIAQVLEARTGGSLSQKPRVQQTLKSKKIRNLNTDIVDFKKKELPGTPGSIIKTPRELNGDVTPGARDGSVIVKPLALEPIMHAHRAQERLSKELKVLQIWKQQVYTPGPIKAALPTPTAYRKNSTATLESFVGAVEGYNRSRRASDDAALDDVVAFFESLGIVHQAGPDELDRFWEPAAPRQVRPAPVKAPMSPRPPGEAPQRPGPALRSSTSPAPSPLLSPNSGQRMRLRRLLGLIT